MARRFSGSALLAHRTAAGVSRELLAVKIGRSASSIAVYERDVATPPVRQAAALADALGVDLNDLLVEVDDGGVRHDVVAA